MTKHNVHKVFIALLLQWAYCLRLQSLQCQVSKQRSDSMHALGKCREFLERGYSDCSALPVGSTDGSPVHEHLQEFLVRMGKRSFSIDYDVDVQDKWALPERQSYKIP